MRVMITPDLPDGTSQSHPADYHAEITAEKIVVVAETATPETVLAARDFRKKVEQILTSHHEGVCAHECKMLEEHGLDRLDHELDADGDGIIDGGLVDEITAAARGTPLEQHFAKSDVRAAIQEIIAHESRSQMLVEREVHAANHRKMLAKKPKGA